MSCIVPMCDNVGEHRFPKDVHRRQLWLKAIDFESRTKLDRHGNPRQLCPRSLVCFNHFKPTDFRLSVTNGIERRFLKKDAVPSVFPWANDSTDRQDSIEASSSKEPYGEFDVRFVQRRCPLTYSTCSKDEELLAQIPTNAEDVLIIPNTSNDEEIAEQGFLNMEGCCISCLCKHNQRRLHTYAIQNEHLQRMFQNENLTLCYICRKLASSAEKFVASVQNNQRYLAQAGTEVSDTKDMKPSFKSLVELTTNNLNAEDVIIKFDERPCDRSPQKLTDEYEPDSYKEHQLKQEILVKNEDPLQNSNNIDIKHISQPGSVPTDYEAVTIKIENVSDDELQDTSINNDDSPQNSVFPVSLIRTLPKLIVRNNLFEEGNGGIDKLVEAEKTPRKRNIGKTVDGGSQNKVRKTGDESENEDCEKEESSTRPKRRNRSKVKNEDLSEELEEADNKRKNDIYEIIKISKEQSLKELAESAKDAKYLEAPFKCTDCVKGFIIKNLYEEHMLLHEESRGDHVCVICKCRFPHPKAVCHHSRKHYFRFRCRACDFLRKNGCSVIEHFQKEHSKQTNVCGECGKTLATPKSLKRHMKNVHTRVDKRITCQYCDNTFKCKYILKNHLANKHTEQVSSADYDINRHKCPHCPRGFTVPSRLKRHIMQKHTEFPDYYCTQCDKYFRTKDSLKNHEKFDPGHVFKHKKPFQCDYCGRRFRRKLDVKNHIVSLHLQRDLVKCTLCDKECKGEAGNTYHMRAAHGDGINRTQRPKEHHTCHFCEKTFLGEKWLNNHIRKHHDSSYRADFGEEDEEMEAAAFNPADVVETEFGGDE